MAYNEILASRVRSYLQNKNIIFNEKKMFGGLAFIVNDIMCINISGDNLMCRFNPKDIDSVSTQPGYTPMIMRGKKLDGYAYVTKDGYFSEDMFKYWLELCLHYNHIAPLSKKSKRSE